MLDPRDRGLLLDALRPPPGFVLDRAIGTTFTLDLLALLTVPLAFTFFGWDEKKEDDGLDPILLLEALRRNADRMVVFCQSGHIKVPRTHRPLFSYLEESIVEVAAPAKGGLFHPKVWTLRYQHAADDRPPKYRLLVLSRNLTFDQAWDTLLVLEGELTKRTRAFAANHPLGDFLAALPGLAVGEMPARARQNVDQLSDEIRRVRFDLPALFREIRFWPLGLSTRHSWPFEGRRDRTLIVSPFLSNGLLKQLTSEGDGHFLISRLEAAEQLDSDTFGAFEAVYQLTPAADPEEEERSQVSPSAPTEEDPGAGLHAKVYVADAGWDARVWTGSANATHAAFHSNVEFLVELLGSKSRCGIDVMLNRNDEQGGLYSLLEEIPPSAEPPPDPPLIESLKRELLKVRLQLCRTPMFARAVPDDAEAKYVLRLFLSSPGSVEMPLGVDIWSWPITLTEEVHSQRVELSSEPVADFGECSFEGLTSFFGFRIRLQEGEDAVEARFVRNIPLHGAPKDRRERILHTVLKDRKEVLRFLLLLLSREDWVAELGEEGSGSSWGLFFGGFGTGEEFPLLESLLRAADRSPAKLDDVDRFIRDLSRTKEGRELLPEGLEQIWAPIWQARRRTS